MKNYIILSSLLFLSFFQACKKDSSNASDNTWLGLQFPKNFPAPHYSMNDNPVTKEGFELGKKLFYDPILSRNNTISCGSCHIQTSAFTHHGHRVSHGIDDLLGKRNAPPIQNLLWQTSFFWDGGVHNLDMIALNPISNPVEMDEDLSNVLQKLKNHSEYPTLFKKAFGTDNIETRYFLQALSQFMGMLISANSKYDKYKRGEGVSLTTDEMQGLQLFETKCASCHKGELFSDFSFRNNGITNDFLYDKGRYEISALDSDIGKFKVPSLRNIEKTAPYMHTGNFTSLESVLDHYSSGVLYSPTLDTSLIKGNSEYGISLTEIEKQKIILFLKTLTDEEFIRNPLFNE